MYAVMVGGVCTVYVEGILLSVTEATETIVSIVTFSTGC